MVSGKRKVVRLGGELKVGLESGLDSDRVAQMLTDRWTREALQKNSVSRYRVRIVRYNGLFVRGMRRMGSDRRMIFDA